MPTGKRFIDALGLVKVEEDKLKVNLAVCKRYLEAQLREIEKDKTMRKYHSSLVPFDLGDNGGLRFVAIPHHELIETNSDTTEALLSVLRTPPLAYPYVAWKVTHPNQFMLYGNHEYLSRDIRKTELAVVIGFDPSWKPEKKQ